MSNRLYPYPKSIHSRTRLKKHLASHLAETIDAVNAAAKAGTITEKQASDHAWRLYALTISPALVAASWPVEDSQIHGGEKKYPWRRKRFYRWRPRTCPCGCGNPGSGFVKTRTHEHERVLRWRISRIILRQDGGGVVTDAQLKAAAKYWPGLLTTQEKFLYNAIQKLDQ